MVLDDKLIFHVCIKKGTNGLNNRSPIESVCVILLLYKQKQILAQLISQIVMYKLDMKTNTRYGNEH